MKKLFFLAVFFIGFSAFAQEEVTLNWLTDFDKAKKISKKTNKPILIYFTGSDWCPPCKMLKEAYFYTEKFEEKSEEFVLVMADLPRRTDIITDKQRKENIKLASKYNKKGSYPNIVIVDYKGKEIDNISGFNMMRDTSRHERFINKIIENY
ncbi:Disulfide bond reductase DsbH [Kordia antarctica]|uniref:Disulfide bond reductase DsbH n=1 Tax=Kordia antarctica TaxID=1218801 RepID=A0A7L4ZR74_9FLAO|nr:thioredoxin family protein [Kordia antarctica]QHI39155.1 Disulfide bond reductase DsbH [Kordia antarctica]